MVPMSVTMSDSGQKYFWRGCAFGLSTRWGVSQRAKVNAPRRVKREGEGVDADAARIPEAMWGGSVANRTRGEGEEEEEEEDDDDEEEEEEDAAAAAEGGWREGEDEAECVFCEDLLSGVPMVSILTMCAGRVDSLLWVSFRFRSVRCLCAQSAGMPMRQMSACVERMVSLSSALIVCFRRWELIVLRRAMIGCGWLRLLSGAECLMMSKKLFAVVRMVTGTRLRYWLSWNPAIRRFRREGKMQMMGAGCCGDSDVLRRVRERRTKLTRESDAGGR